MKANNSYIYRKGTTPNTRTAISSKVKVFSYAYNLATWTQIGVMTSFNPSQSRSADPIRGVGYGDQIAELVPGVMDPISISVERAALYLANLFQVFGYRGGSDGLVRALKHLRWPFDVKQEMAISDLALADESANSNQGDSPGIVSGGDTSIPDSFTEQVLLTIYEGCWMTDYNFTVSSDTSMISESTTLMCTDIVDGRNNYHEFIASGNARGFSPQAGGVLQRSRLFSGGISNAVAG